MGETTPLLSRIENENPETEFTISTVDNVQRPLIFAKIITIIGVILGFMILVSRYDQSGTKTSSFKNVANLQGTAFGQRNRSTIV